MKFKLAYLSFVLLLMGGWNPSGVFAEDGGDPPVEEGGEIDEGVDEGVDEGIDEGVDEGIDEGAPAGGGDTDEGGMTLLDLLTAGGAVGYLILALSVIGLGLVFENFFSVRRSQLMPPEIIEELERYFQEEAYEEALELCDAEQNLLTNMIGAGLSKIAGGYDAITEAMDSALEEGATALHQKVNYLSLIGNVAPMMGLIGTVQGMIAAFDTMKRQGGAPKPAELAGDISLALVTTLLGLCVAIPMLAFHMFLKNRVVKIILEAEAVATELMERFKAS
ncbi:MAG: MotA/TolQ/ExbB proton channel family protein [Planctomycetota bacterium]|nr:MotA/TolQ/ExbB proton channel family protein [Planctomycetota bacterium]